MTHHAFLSARLNPVRRPAVIAMALTLLFATFVVPVPAATAAPAEMADESAAVSAAREHGVPVRVASKTTETEEVLANPDGTFTWRQSRLPNRVLRDGEWKPVDLSLERKPDGTIGPVETTVDVRLSRGGSEKPLVVAAKEGHEVGLRWDGELPEPVLKGSSATYANVLPDVDLVVTAQPLGFSQVLVVKTREAARNPKLRKVRFGSHVKNGSLREVAKADGKWNSPPGLRVQDAEGRIVFEGDASQMWDSSGSAVSDRAVGPGPGGRQATMGVEVADDAVAVTPDHDFLTAPETTYPVYIDPKYNWAGAKNHHAVVQSGHPDARNYDRTDGDLGDLKTGYIGGADGYSRSYIEMNFASMRGKFIHSATLRTKVIHSYGCNGGATNLWTTNSINSGTTFNNQPTLGRLQSSTSVSNNASYCPSSGGADFGATSAAQQAASGGWTNITFVLRAANENDINSWRRYALNPTLEVVFNSYPNASTEPSMEGGLIPCVTGENRPFVATPTPRLRARVSDPDRGLLSGHFALRKGPVGASTWVNNYATHNVPSGSFAEVTLPSGVLGEEGVYHWLMQSSDGQLVSSYVGNCEFSVDRTAPGMPAVTSAEYPYDEPSGSLGQTGTFTLDANGTSDVKYYLYSFTEDETDDPQTRVDASGLGGTATVRWTPTLEGPQTMFVRSVDRAGNRSEIYRYKVFVKANEPLTPGLVGHWKLDNGLTEATGSGHDLQAAGGPAEGRPGYFGESVEFDGVDDHLKSSTAVLDTSKSFSVTAWAKLNTVGRYPAVVSQDGTNVSGFQLQATPSGHWGFVMFSVDSAGGGVPHVRLISDNPAQLGVWTQLTAVYDGGDRELRLYVDGVLAGELAYTSTWKSTGPLIVGGAKYNGARVDYFPGAIDDVRAYRRVIVPAEAKLLANQAVLRAHYAMEEGTGTTTRDEVTGQDASFRADPSWSVEEFTGIQFDAAYPDDYDYLSAPRPQIRTDRSYTVSAWVRADRFDASSRQAVSMDHANFTPFALGYRGNTGKWSMVAGCSPTTECGSTALSEVDAVLGEWVHLTGVHDAVADELRIYVNGQFSGKSRYADGWNDAGDLLIGRTVWRSIETDHWRGALDDVKVFAGIPTDVQIGQLAVR